MHFQPPLSPGEMEREKERVSLLLQLNTELLREIVRMQAEGKAGPTPRPEPAGDTSHVDFSEYVLPRLGQMPLLGASESHVSENDMLSHSRFSQCSEPCVACRPTWPTWPPLPIELISQRRPSHGGQPSWLRRAAFLPSRISTPS